MMSDIPNCFWKVIEFHSSSHHQPVVISPEINEKQQQGYFTLFCTVGEIHLCGIKPQHPKTNGSTGPCRDSSWPFIATEGRDCAPENSENSAKESADLS